MITQSFALILSISRWYIYAGTIHCSVSVSTALHTCRCRHWFHSANSYSSVIIQECDEVYQIFSLLWAVTQYEFSWQIAVSLARVDPESVSDNLPSISPFLSSPPAVPGQFRIKEKKITQSCCCSLKSASKLKWLTDQSACYVKNMLTGLMVLNSFYINRIISWSTAGNTKKWDNEKIPCHSPKLHVHICFRVICHCKFYR